MELCAKAPPVGQWPIGFLRDARQLYRLPCCIVEPRKVRHTLSERTRKVGGKGPPSSVKSPPALPQKKAVSQAAFSHQWRSLQTGAGESRRPAHVGHVLS